MSRVEIAEGGHMVLYEGVPAIIGRAPEAADYIEQFDQNEYCQVTLKIPDDIAGYFPRAALVMFTIGGKTVIEVPEGASSGVVVFDTRDNPIAVDPNKKVSFNNGEINKIDSYPNGHVVRLRYASSGSKEQGFLFEVDPIEPTKNERRYVDLDSR